MIEVMIVTSLGLIFGLAIGYFLATRTKILDGFTKEGRKIKKTINNPNKLVKKMRETENKLGGIFVDDGDYLRYALDDNKQLKEVRVCAAEPEPEVPKPKEDEWKKL